MNVPQMCFHYHGRAKRKKLVWEKKKERKTERRKARQTERSEKKVLMSIKRVLCCNREISGNNLVLPRLSIH